MTSARELLENAKYKELWRYKEDKDFQWLLGHIDKHTPQFSDLMLDFVLRMHDIVKDNWRNFGNVFHYQIIRGASGFSVHKRREIVGKLVKEISGLRPRTLGKINKNWKDFGNIVGAYFLDPNLGESLSGFAAHDNVEIVEIVEILLTMLPNVLEKTRPSDWTHFAHVIGSSGDLGMFGFAAHQKVNKINLLRDFTLQILEKNMNRGWDGFGHIIGGRYHDGVVTGLAAHHDLEIIKELLKMILAIETAATISREEYDMFWDFFVSIVGRRSREGWGDGLALFGNINIIKKLADLVIAIQKTVAKRGYQNWGEFADVIGRKNEKGELIGMAVYSNNENAIGKLALLTAVDEVQEVASDDWKEYARAIGYYDPRGKPHGLLLYKTNLDAAIIVVKKMLSSGNTPNSVKKLLEQAAGSFDVLKRSSESVVLLLNEKKYLELKQYEKDPAFKEVLKRIDNFAQNFKDLMLDMILGVHKTARNDWRSFAYIIGDKHKVKSGWYETVGFATHTDRKIVSELVNMIIEIQNNLSRQWADFAEIIGLKTDFGSLNGFVVHSNPKIVNLLIQMTKQVAETTSRKKQWPRFSWLIGHADSEERIYTGFAAYKDPEMIKLLITGLILKMKETASNNWAVFASLIGERYTDTANDPKSGGSLAGFVAHKNPAIVRLLIEMTLEMQESAMELPGFFKDVIGAVSRHTLEKWKGQNKDEGFAAYMNDIGSIKKLIALLKDKRVQNFASKDWFAFAQFIGFVDSKGGRHNLARYSGEALDAAIKRFLSNPEQFIEEIKLLPPGEKGQ